MAGLSFDFTIERPQSALFKSLFAWQRKPLFCAPIIALIKNHVKRPRDRLTEARIVARQESHHSRPDTDFPYFQTTSHASLDD